MHWKSYITNAFGDGDDWKTTTAKVVGALTGVAVVGYGSYRLYNYYYDSRKTTKVPPFSPKTEASADGQNEPLEKSLEVAMRFKEAGNKMYLASKYVEAKKLYTDAILRCPPEEMASLAVFYQNRAAASDSMEQWTAVIRDCDEAISRDEKYQKAYARRGKAKLALKQYDLAILDTACGYFLQTSKKTKQNLDAYMAAISEVSRTKAAEIIQARVTPLDFGIEVVRSYIANSPLDPVLSQLQSYADVEKELRRPFHDACEKMRKPEPSAVIVALLDAELKDSNTTLKAEALYLRATVMSIGGCPVQADKDFTSILAIDSIDARMRSATYLRRGLLHVNTESYRGMGDIEKAAEADPTYPDVFHQRAQIAMLMQNVQQADSDFIKANELHKKETGEYDTHVLIHKMACDLHLAAGNHMEIIEKMERLCKEHPDQGELWLIYCQALMFFGKHQEADDGYVEGLKQCSDNPRIYIQRAALVITWKRDTEKALEYLNMAKAIDPVCDAAYESLAAVLLQAGRLEEALAAFHQQLRTARAHVEVQQVLCMIEALQSQIYVQEKFKTGPLPNVFMSPEPRPN